MSSSLQGKRFQPCGSAGCFFPSPWWLFSPLRIGMNSSMCAQPPTTPAVCHSGLSLPDHVLCPDGTSVVPTSSKKEHFCLLFPFSPFHHSGPLNIWAATYFSARSSLFLFRSPSFQQMLSPFHMPAACLFGSCPMWIFFLPLAMYLRSQVSYLNVIIGNCKANVVVVTSHFIIRRAADWKDTFYSQLVC